MTLAHRIQTVLGLFFLLLCMPCIGAAQTTCSSPWSSTTAYTSGMRVSLNGTNYTANFWRLRLLLEKTAGPRWRRPKARAARLLRSRP